MVVISIVFIGVGASMFGNVTDGTDAILDYEYSSNASITDASFTGLTSITGLSPMLVLIGYLAVALLAGFFGVQIAQGKREGKMSPGGIIMLGISLVFIALGFYVFPVALDGFAYVLHGGGNGINAAYTGLASIVKLAPMLLLIGYVAATVIVGMFGLKMNTQSTED
jgi:hypothetical protein